MPSLRDHPIHLGPGATASVQPQFDGMDWYGAYDERHGADGAEGRLVAQWQFDQSWESWEIHPHGAEVVLCLSGSITLIQELADGSTRRVPLAAGEYAINPPGTWHTADLAPGETADCLFITPGDGTTNRPR